MHNINRTPLGVRKGAWTQEEDVLLKKCINKYGVGKWSQVPLRSGLNRCRKSCRLRWLNYLRPNIKRGSFTADEVDLMIRLHKLLGNRWSLIAGRLPERTANDVKNYWNTNLSKKPVVASCREDHEKIKAKNANEEAKLVKPRPRRIFAKNLQWLKGKTTIIDNNQSRDINVATPSPLGLFDSVDGILRLEDKVVDGGPGNTWPMSAPCYEPNITGLWAQETSSGIMVGDTSDQEGPNGWSHFSMDVNLWDLLTD